MTLRPLCPLRDALSDPDLLGRAIPGDSWLAWRVLLIAAMGEPLVGDERGLFRDLTGREEEPGEQVDELWGIVGRRGGKTRAAGTLASYIAGLCDHESYLASGERGVLPIMAASKQQADRAFQHASGILRDSSALRELIEGEPTQEKISLATRVDIEIRSANFRTIRGITAPAIIADEVAFWSIEGSANPDKDILDAARPGLATTGGPLIVISSPHAKRGELYSAYRRDYGPEGDRLVLVARAASRVFNPLLPERVVARAYERDATVAASEYGAEFRNDISGFVTRDVVDACVEVGVTERAPESGVTYRAFVDPSGGMNDPMTLAIGHREGSRIVIDCQRERKPPFSPEAVVEEFVHTLRAYGCSEVTGDRYGGDWPPEQFRKRGVTYCVSERVRSDLYRTMLPTLNSRTVALLDHPVTVAEICSLERRVARSGHESIDHPPNGHDDCANAVAGVVSLFTAKPGFDLEIFLKAYG